MGELVRCKRCSHIYKIYPSIPASDDSCPKCGENDYQFIKTVKEKLDKIKESEG